MIPMQLRLACAEDIPAVAAVELRAHRHPWSAPMLAAELQNERARLVLAVFPSEMAEEARATAGDAPIAAVSDGVLGGYIVYWLVADELHVLNVATDPRWRRRGIGRRLLGHAESDATTVTVSFSTLEVRPSNVEALGLYDRFGYREVARRRGYYDDGEEAIIMVKTFGPGGDAPGPVR